jgi:Flp pilus assembly protein TadG
MIAAALRRAGYRMAARLAHEHGGATAVEMAFLLPVFLLFMLGIEELGRALWTQVSLQFAVEAASRCAAVSPSLCTPTVEGYAASQVFGMSIPSSAFTYTPNATCGVASSSTGSGGAQVDASYTFRPVLDISGLYTVLGVSKGQNPLNLTLRARSCHP